MKFFFAYLLFLLPAFYSCKKVIPVDLNSAAPQIVIEGGVVDTVGPYLVKISKTVNFSDDNTFPPVSGAAVQITDSNLAQTYTLMETSPGSYTSASMDGQEAHTYLLSVSAEGKVYTASSTMPAAAVPLDSVTCVKNLNFSNDKTVDAVVNFQDPPGSGNDYQFIETVDGKQLPDIFVFEDRLSDGRYIQQELYNNKTNIHPGDILKVDMYCIDKNIYSYFFSLFQVTGDNGFASASPANPNSNISNGALGYFSAHTVKTKTLRAY